ncbi:MAG: endonuclease MutS2, partial [Trueperaceae bacterium]
MHTSPTLLDKLAYERVREALADRAATRLGMARARALAPLPDRATAQRRLERAEAIAADGDLPLGGIEDVRPLLHDAREGRMLEGREILSVAYTLEGADRLRRDVAERDRPVLTELAERMGSFEGWLRRVREQLDADGEVKDDATPKLREIRRRLRPLRGRIRDKMEKLLERYASSVQDPIVTLRRDRYVIPVQASAQGKVPGIALDTSDSGRTVFVEPQEVVPLNNELALLEFEERDEVRRVLLELGRSVADHPEVDPTLDLIAWLDLANASARLAEDWRLLRAEAPAGDPDAPAAMREVRLPRARHPLIDGCVPNDLVLDAGYRLLVVTGPNAGGKTVLLKTLGLAVLMAQSGLGVAAGEPADPPRLPWFDAV